MKEYLLVGGPRDGERIRAEYFHGRRFNTAFEDRIIRYKPVPWAYSDRPGGIVLLEENIPEDQLIPMLISGYRQPK